MKKGGGRGYVQFSFWLILVFCLYKKEKVKKMQATVKELTIQKKAQKKVAVVGGGS